MPQSSNNINDYVSYEVVYSVLSRILSKLGYIPEDTQQWEIYNKELNQEINLGGSRIDITTGTNWVSIGIPLIVKCNTNYNIKFDYNNGLGYNIRQGYTHGIACQILNGIPTNDDCSSLKIQEAYLSNETFYEGSIDISFSVSGNTDEIKTVYFVLNSGFASAGQSIEFDVYNFSINGK